MLDFAAFIELLCGFDTRGEVQILLSLNCRTRSEKEPDFVCWNDVYISIDSTVRLPPYHPPWETQEEDDDEHEGEEFTH